MFDGELYSSYYRANDGQLITDPSASNFYKYVHSNLIPCTPQTTYTLKYVCTYTNKFVIFTWYSGDTFITSTSFTNVDAHTLTVTAPLSATKFGITISGIDNNPYTQTTIVPADISNIMLNLGDTALPYEPYGYRVPVTVNDIITNLYLPEPIKMVGDEAEYVDYAEQKQHRVRKNLLPNTVTNQTINGVTFTVNEDGSITCNGTATNTVEIRLVISFSLPAGNYRLTGTPSSGSTSSYYLRAWYSSGTTTVWLMDGGSGYNFTLTDTATMNISIVIRPNQVLNHIIFYPMIRKADIEDDTYEPYIENTDLDVTLPALPTLPGTNVLSVETEVQPSSVEIEGRIKPVVTGGG